MAELRGVPPLVLVYDPHVTTRESGSLRDEAWVEGVLGAILRAPAANTEEAAVVAVIDGTDFDETDQDSRELLSWEFLFHRMNEQRNAIARTLHGTLALALPPALVRVFLEEAPDVASIRSDVLSFDAAQIPKHPDRPHLRSSMGYSPDLLREAAQRRLAADPRLDSEAREHARRSLAAPQAISIEESPAPSHTAATHALRSLLMSLFTADELRSFLGYSLEPRELTSLSHDSSFNFIDKAIGSLKDQGLINEYFFYRLRDERPRRKSEIDHVAALHLATSTSARPQLKATAHWTPTPDELMDALLKLSREQIAQVVRLADDEGLAAPITRSGAAHTKMVHRTRMPVRELVSQGPEAVQRLADALVTLGYHRPV
ncbi:hypothetical protein OV090_44860 [Nannocystis sp. RBIL2]|uniref:hypothetical protein n=1 Tax=Nannocystis sp. RBIL2 TaxID=2996788 RepID=UPI002270347E|nr:hypothetical protein [Nannocystis sp. RBIL2]MCY1071960.1 hypothetical protein [Nannocystis sp. RBIL2]